MNFYDFIWMPTLFEFVIVMVLFCMLVFPVSSLALSQAEGKHKLIKEDYFCI